MKTILSVNIVASPTNIIISIPAVYDIFTLSVAKVVNFMVKLHSFVKLVLTNADLLSEGKFVNKFPIPVVEKIINMGWEI